MIQGRREFLQAGLVGALVSVAGGERGVAAESEEQRQGTMGGLVLATLTTSRGQTLGVRTEKGIIDVAAAESDMRLGAPLQVDAAIRQHGDLEALRKLIERAAGDSRYLVGAQEARFGPCVTQPEKIVCVGLNYKKHVAEVGAQIPPEPRLFNKYNQALNHHGGRIEVSKETARHFDYETELVIVIGRTARNVSEADALSYVFGYCIGQDFSAREQQARQIMLGKAGDGWAPIGPWLVSADLLDAQNLNIETRVNGEIRQSSNTSDMIFNCRQLISFISSYMTLKPGDIIFTGTPEGVILGMPKEKQVWLKAGDKIVSSIEKLGQLEFTLT
jgi:2-keto-4-pentenoate hydratase/2-oxohepta-3-ene-1,7-dioic acid hydratase in catechol pathway